MGIILSIHVLAAFIYFIHSISQAIQINNITDRIFGAASTRLQTLIDKENKVEGIDVFDDISDWHGYKSTSSGYLNDIAFDSLSKLAKDCDISIKMLVSKGEFVLVDVPIVKVSKELDEENQDMLQSCFGFSRSEIVKLNYVLGFKQLTEIAVKAMSPGINDPGTAITCIDYLTELFALRMLKKDNSYVVNDDNKAVVSLDTVDFDELIYYIFASLRQYCKADFIMMTKMLTSLYYLKNVKTIDDSYKEVINRQAQLVLVDAQAFIKNETDLKNLEKFAEKFE